jgi:hypothetical protein
MSLGLIACLGLDSTARQKKVQASSRDSMFSYPRLNCWPQIPALAGGLGPGKLHLAWWRTLEYNRAIS